MLHDNDKLNVWLGQVLSMPVENVTPLAGDASSRQYYRVVSAEKSYILMQDPIKDSRNAFLSIGKKLASHGLRVPEVLAHDSEQGFLLLSDFGDTLYLHILTEDNVNHLYHHALEALLKLQTYAVSQDNEIPFFDASFIHKQFAIFTEWYLEQHLQYQGMQTIQNKLHATFEWLIKEIEAQPKVLMHMDYHSKNLMVLGAEDPGVLDFQDAMIGPITYDLSSLLKDAYIRWPSHRIQEWVQLFQDIAIERGLLEEKNRVHFWRWFELTGIQRHIKNLGIFARLCYRDQKPGYLKHIPLLLEYIQEVCEQYTELEWFGAFLKQVSTPLKISVG